MKVKIEIDTKTLIRFWLVIFGFIIFAGLIWVAKDVLIMIIIAAFLALALNDPFYPVQIKTAWRRLQSHILRLC